MDKFYQYMQYALEEAHKAFNEGEVPVGAVVVFDNKIIASAHNVTERCKNATQHAEIVAIQKACNVLDSKYLIDASIFVTLEPCPMCAHAISLAKIKNLYFGAEDKKGGGVINGSKIYQSSSCHHKPSVYENIMENECSAILKKFFNDKR